MTIRIILLFIGIAWMGRNVAAQQTNTAQEQFRTQLNTLQGFLTTIASQQTTADAKQEIVEQTLSMFDKEATAQVSSGRMPKRVLTYSVNEYLQNLSLLGYKTGAFQFSDVSLELKANPAKDSIQHFIGSFRQAFRGKSGKRVYADVTRKKVEVVLQPIADSLSIETDWVVRFKTIQISR